MFDIAAKLDELQANMDKLEEIKSDIETLQNARLSLENGNDVRISAIADDIDSLEMELEKEAEGMLK